MLEGVRGGGWGGGDELRGVGKGEGVEVGVEEMSYDLLEGMRGWGWRR